eukprot:PRCOL_00005652-RA
MFTSRRFDFVEAKARVSRAFEDAATPSKFRSFFKSELMDDFLHTTIAYFVAYFAARRAAAAAAAASVGGNEAGGGGAGDDVGDDRGAHEGDDETGAGAGDGAREAETTNADGDATGAFSPFRTAGGAAAQASVAEAEAACEARLADISPVYARIIMTCSDYEHTQQDKLFFESLYEATNLVLQEAFAGQRKVHDVEIELGRIFRTNYFNLARRRKAKGSGSRAHEGGTLSSRELYALKHEGDPALNSRILEQYYAKRERGGVMDGAKRVSAIIERMLPK